MKKKRLLNLLLALTVIFGLVLEIRLTAYAAQYLSGTVNLTDLRSGDIFGNGVIVSHNNFFNLTIDGESGNVAYNGGGMKWTTPQNKQFIFVKYDLTSEKYPRLYATTYYPTYTVTFNKNCNESVSGLPGNNKMNTTNGKLNLPTLSRSGYVFDGWYTAATDGNFVGVGGQSYSPSEHTTLYAGWTAHVHSYTYSSSGSTITATCSNTDGAHSGSLTQTLTIVAPAKTTYGDSNSAEATLEGLSDFNSKTNSTVEEADILYVGIGNSTYSESNTAPTEIGTYIAKISVYGKEAVVEYEIAKSSPGTPIITMSDYTYAGTVSKPSIGIYSGDGTVTYFFNSTDSNSGGQKWQNILNTTLTAGTYYMYATVSETDIYTSYTTATQKFMIAKAAITDITAPTAKVLTYTGSAQELVTEGTSEDGTLQYALGKDAITAPTSGWDTTIPKGTEAGTYYVWYKVKGDENHTDSKAACVTATINKKEISRTVTFKVVNGSWDDGKSEDKTVTLTGYEGDELKLSKDQIPAVGNKPGSGYAAGSWDKTPSTSTAITGAATYTYTYTKLSDEPSEEPSSEKAKVTKAPTAKKLTYNGKDQKLVAKGTASNGKMYYAVTKNTTAPKASAYKTSIPTGKAAGTYYVWYKVKGDKGYKDSAVKKVKVTIAKKTEEEPFNFNTSFKVTQKDGQVTVTWNKVNGLSKVDAYVAYCGNNYPEKKFTSTTKNTLTIKKIAGKKIDLTKDFKLTLVGYDSTGKKTKKSVSLHIAGKDNKKFTNVKSFTLSKASVSVKKGKSTKVSVKTYKLEDTKKKELSDAHAAKFRYRSTNSKIAKVDKNGRITGVKKGKCKVFVYTRNGLARKIAVTVTK